MALDFETFKANLKSGKYESLAGARRAVGKAGEFTDEQRDAARKLVDKQFNAAPQGTKVAAPKKAAKEAPKAEKKVAAPKKEAKAASVKREPKVAAKPAPVKREPKAYELKGTVKSAGLDLDDLGSISSQLRIAEATCAHATGAINALKGIGAQTDDSDVQEARNTLSGAISIFRQLVGQVNKVEPAKVRKPKTADVEATEVPLNGVSGSKAESLFANSRPDAATES